MIDINKQQQQKQQYLVIILLAISSSILTINATTTPNNNMTIPNEAEGSSTDDKDDDKDKEKIPEAILKSPPLKTPASETIEKMKDICENKPMGKWDSKERECNFPTYDTNSEKEKAAFEDKLAEEGLWEAYQEEQDEERQAAIDEYNRNADKAHPPYDNDNDKKVEEEEEEEQAARDADYTKQMEYQEEKFKQLTDAGEEAEVEEDDNRDYDDDPLNDSENVEGGN